MDNDSLKALAKRILNPTRRGFGGTLAGAVLNPQTALASGATSIATTALSATQLDVLAMAVFYFPSVQSAITIPKGPNGISDGLLSNYFIDLSESARALHSLNSVGLANMAGTLDGAQKLSLAQYISDAYGLGGESIGLDEAKQLVANLFNAEGFQGRALNQFADIAKQRIMQNVEILAPKLAQLDTTNLCRQLIEHEVGNVHEMPLRLLEEFGDVVPQELADNWGQAYARSCETMERMRVQKHKNQSEEDAQPLEGWGRDWFVIKGGDGRFDFFCTANDPRRQRTILLGLEEQARAEFYDCADITDMAYNSDTQRSEFHIAAEAGSKAERVLSGLALESERVLAASRRVAL